MSAHCTLVGAHQQYLSVAYGFGHIERAAALSEYLARSRRSGVLREPRLYRGEGIRKILDLPCPEITLPPIEDERVPHPSQYPVAKSLVREHQSPVQQGVLIVARQGLVRLVERL